MVTADFNGNVRVWDLPSTDNNQRVMKHPGQVWDVAFSPDSRRLAAGCIGGAGVKGGGWVWDLATGGRTELRHGADTVVVRFHPSDSDCVLTAGNDGWVRLWGAGQGELRHELGPHTSSPIQTVEFSPGGERLVVAGDGREVTVWDIAADPTKRALVHKGVYSFVWNAAFSPGGRSLLTCGGPNAWWWNLTAGEQPPVGLWVTPPRSRDRPDSRAALSPDGRWAVVTAIGRPAAALWSLAGGHGPDFLGSESGEHTGEITARAFSPDSSSVATASMDGSVRLWEVSAPGRPAATLRHDSPVEAVAFSPDGATLATGTLDGVMRLWQRGMPNTTSHWVWTGAAWFHGGPVTKVEFSRDGRQVVTASRDSTARICRRPAAESGTPAQLRLRVEVLTGMAITVDLLAVDLSAASASLPKALSADEWAVRLGNVVKSTND